MVFIIKMKFVTRNINDMSGVIVPIFHLTNNGRLRLGMWLAVERQPYSDRLLQKMIENDRALTISVQL